MAEGQTMRGSAAVSPGRGEGGGRAEVRWCRAGGACGTRREVGSSGNARHAYVARQFRSLLQINRKNKKRRNIRTSRKLILAYKPLSMSSHSLRYRCLSLFDPINWHQSQGRVASVFIATMAGTRWSTRGRSKHRRSEVVIERIIE
jgi:hypothetical protein